MPDRSFPRRHAPIPVDTNPLGPSEPTATRGGSSTPKPIVENWGKTDPSSTPGRGTIGVVADHLAALSSTDLGGVPMVVAVRILWIDAPETRGERAMPEGDTATETTRRFIDGRQVVLRDERGDEFQRDRYGRILARVLVVPEPGTEGYRSDLGTRLVRVGAAVYWQRYGSAPYRASWHYENAHNYAQEAGAGVWGTAREWAEARAAERPDE